MSFWVCPQNSVQLTYIRNKCNTKMQKYTEIQTLKLSKTQKETLIITKPLN